MKSFLAASLIASAAAFAPASQKASTTALSAFDASQEIGVLSPTGLFDPLGFCDGATEEDFKRWRSIELKHGRISMLAVVGYVVPEFYRWPGDIDLHGTAFADIPNGLDAFHVLPAVGAAQMFGIIGLVETEGLWTYAVGAPDLPEEILVKRQTQELQHGRLAMIAILELLHHDIVTDGEPLVQGLPFLY